MSFWGDLTEVGSGLLESVGESAGKLVDGSVEKKINPKEHKQSNDQIDKHGNKVTEVKQVPQDKTMLYVAGGVAAVAVLGLIVVAVK